MRDRGTFRRRSGLGGGPMRSAPLDRLDARLTFLTRLGFASRGVLYTIIALLVILAGRTEDQSGALQYLASGAGRWLLVLLALGLAAYGLWRLADAILNIERHEDKAKGWAERAGALVSGLVHFFFAWQAARLTSGPQGAAGGTTPEEGARTALGLPGGPVLVLLGGLALLAVGLFQFVEAYKTSFCDRLDPRVARQPWVKLAGRAGYAARGVVFLIAGAFLTNAGLQNRASEAGGLDQALAWLQSPWDVIVALGLLMFGLFSFVEARHRIIQDVPVGDLADKARSHLPGRG